MKNIIISLSAAMIILLLTSCLGTVRTASFVNPDITTKQYTRICVMFDTDDLLSKQDLEDEINDYLLSYGCQSFCSYDFIFPGREYSDRQIHKLLVKYEIDAYMLLSIADKEYYERVIPASEETVTSTKTKQNKAGKDLVTTTTTSTNYTAEKTEYSNVTDYSIKLIDVETSEVVWTAYSRKTNRQSYFALAKSIVENLSDDGLIQ